MQVHIGDVIEEECGFEILDETDIQIIEEIIENDEVIELEIIDNGETIEAVPSVKPIVESHYGSHSNIVPTSKSLNLLNIQMALTVAQTEVRKNNPVIGRNLKYGIVFDVKPTGIKSTVDNVWFPEDAYKELNTDAKCSLFVATFCEALNEIEGNNVCSPIVEEIK